MFQGKIEVAPGAQKTDGYQMNQALLLSPDAEIDSKPELEIFADDVKCSHGATVGELDAEQLFYLRSRGIPEADARAMLVRAFLAEALDLVADERTREALEAAIARRWERSWHERDQRDIPLDVAAIRAQFPILARPCAARSWCFSTAPRARKSRAR